MCCQSISQNVMNAILVGVLAGAAAAQDPTASPGELVIWFIDRTESQDPASHVAARATQVKESKRAAEVPPEPDTIQDAIQLKSRVDDLRGRPCRTAAVIMRDDRVELVVDKQGKPFESGIEFRKELTAKWGDKPSGGTRLAAGYDAIWQIIREHGHETKCTVIATGDAIPGDGLLRPGDFDEVQQIWDDFISRGIAPLNGADPDIVRERVDQLTRTLQQQGSEINKLLVQVQQRAEFNACAATANAVATRGVRWVTLAYGDKVELRTLHQEAGGIDDDFRLVQPASKTIQEAHAVHLFAGQGIDIPEPVEFPQPSTANEITEQPFEFSQQFRIPRVAKRGLVVFVPDRSIAEFPKHAELILESSAGRLTAGAASDHEVIMSHDAVGGVSSVIFSLDAVPEDGTAQLTFRSPAQTLKVPSGKIYLFLSRRDDLVTILHPQTAAESAAPPFQVDCEDSLDYFAFIGDPVSGVRLAVEAMEVRFQSAEHQLTREMIADPDYVNSYVSSEPVLLPPGDYDATIVYQFDGVVIEIELPQHLKSIGDDEHIEIDIPVTGEQASRSSRWIEFAPVGDARVSGQVVIDVFGWKKDPIVLEPRIIPAQESPDAPFKADLFLLPKQLTVRLDRPTRLLLQVRLPEFSDSLKNGVMEGLLVFFRPDRKRIVSDIRLRGANDTEITRTALNTVRVEIKRPSVLLEAIVGDVSVTTSVETARAKIDAVFRTDVPTYWQMIVYGNHTSEMDRTLKLINTSEMKVGDMRESERFTLEFDPATPLEQTVAPGQRAVWRIKVRDRRPAAVKGTTNADNKASVELVASGSGVRKAVLQLTAKAVPSPLIVPGVMAAACLGGVLVVGALTYTIRQWRLGRFRAQRVLRLTPHRSLASVGVAPRRGNSPLLTFGPQLAMKRAGELKAKPAGTRYELKDEDRRSRNRLRVLERSRDGVELEVFDWQIDPQGNPSVWVRILRSERFEKLYSAARRRKVLLILAAAPLLIGCWYWWNQPEQIAPWLEPVLSLLY